MRRRGFVGILCLGALLLGACSTRSGSQLALAPGALRDELARRVGADAAARVPVPFLVDGEAVEHARGQLSGRPHARDRIERLVALLTEPPPAGFGIRYRGSRTATAAEALASGEGNCMSLASLLIGLARGLGWRAYYAEVGEPRKERKLGSNLGVLADHIGVVLVTEEERVVVDFLGIVAGRAVRVVGDLRATAHFQNNRAFEEIAAAQARGEAMPWASARQRFELVTRIDPDFARAWNNLGIALARSGRSDDAKHAYERAHSLDPGLSSPEQNLRVLQTRLAGDAGPEVETIAEPQTAP